MYLISVRYNCKSCLLYTSACNVHLGRLSTSIGSRIVPLRSHRLIDCCVIDCVFKSANLPAWYHFVNYTTKVTFSHSYGHYTRLYTKVVISYFLLMIITKDNMSNNINNNFIILVETQFDLRIIWLYCGLQRYSKSICYN